jgi:hypothetical protein
LDETSARRRSVGAPRREQDAFGKLGDLFRVMRGAWGLVEDEVREGEGVEVYRTMYDRLMGPNVPSRVAGGGSGGGNAVAAMMDANANGTVAPSVVMGMPDDAWMNDIFNVTW